MWWWCYSQKGLDAGYANIRYPILIWINLTWIRSQTPDKNISQKNYDEKLKSWEVPNQNLRIESNIKLFIKHRKQKLQLKIRVNDGNIPKQFILIPGQESQLVLIQYYNSSLVVCELSPIWAAQLRIRTEEVHDKSAFGLNMQEQQTRLLSRA